MQLWRFMPWRSARHTARRHVLAGRRVRGWAWASRRLVMYAYRLDWWLALGVAVALSVPMLAYVGKNPGWLDGAWQVSAVLLGFVIALVVFLLQVVVDRSIRGERTYRALLARSRVAWPIAFSLIFIAWAAVIERSGNPKAPAPGWVVTWSVCYFGAQLVALAATFGGVRSLLAPAGVIRVLERALRTDIDRVVEERLTRGEASRLLTQRFTDLGAPGGPALSSIEVRSDRTGYVDDFDLKLPRALKHAGQVEAVQGWSLAFGDRIKSGTGVIARVSGEPTSTAVRLLNAGVHFRRRKRRSGEGLEVFGDTLDLGLKAIAEGVERDIALVTDVVVGGFAEVAHAYRRFGKEYNEKTAYQEVWADLEEDRMAERLRSMSRRAATSDRPEMFVELAVLPYKLALVAIDDDVELLLSHALELWRAQAQQARLIASETLRNRAIDRIHGLSTMVARQLLQRLTGRRASTGRHELAASNLKHIDQFRVQLLRSYVDANDVSSFRGLLGDMTSRTPFDPVADVRQLEQRLATLPSDDSSRPQLQQKLAESQVSAQQLTDVVNARRWGWFHVGAWAAWQHLHRRIDDNTWVEVSQRLAQPFPRDSITDRLVEIVTERDRTSDLDRWNTDTMDIRSTSYTWTPQDTDIALLWAALLILRDTGPASTPQFATGNVRVYADHLRAQLDNIEQNAVAWTGFVGVDVSDRARRVRDALRQAETLSDQEVRQQIADAPLLDTRTEEFERAAREEFDQYAGLRQRLLAADALTVVQADNPADSDLTARQLAGKQDFTNAARNADKYDVRTPARRLAGKTAATQDAWLFARLDDIAETMDDAQTVLAGINAAIDSLKAEGCSPNLIILPGGYAPDTDLTSAPEFRWALDSGRSLAFLEGIEIVDIGPFDANVILVCDLRESIRVTEHAGPNGHPLSTDVTLLDDALAEEILNSGGSRVEQGQTRANAIKELQDLRVLVSAHLDCASAEPSQLRGVRRIKLQPAEPGTT